jgi:hypothetical protein
MKPVEGYRLIKPDELTWRPSNIMRIPNADFLERTGSEILGARLWRLGVTSSGGRPESAGLFFEPKISNIFG